MCKKKYEYEIEFIYDDCLGRPNQIAMSECISKRADAGWKLVGVTTNERGHSNVGYSDTHEYTCLFFEKEIIIPLYETILGGQEKELKVEKTNIIDSFFPKKVLMSAEAENLKISLVVWARENLALSGIETDIIISSMFGEEVHLEKIYFWEFEQMDEHHFKSQYAMIDIPEYIIRSISNISVIIRKYVSNGDLYCVEERKMLVVEEEIKKRKEEIESTEYLKIIRQLNTANEILQFMKKYNEKYSNIFTEDVICKLQTVVDYERIYGSLKTDALKVIEDFLQSS